MALSRRPGRLLAALVAALAVTAIFAVTTAPAGAAARCAHAGAVPTARNLATVRTAVLCLVNRERAGRGLVALRADARLDRAAAAHSLDMVRHRYFDHTSPTGSTVLSRIRATGYLAHARAWAAGENIAWATGRLATPTAIVAAWMHSPGHRANILRPQFRDVGTGVAVGVPAPGIRLGGATYTQDFGARR